MDNVGYYTEHKLCLADCLSFVMQTNYVKNRQTNKKDRGKSQFVASQTIKILLMREPNGKCRID